MPEVNVDALREDMMTSILAISSEPPDVQEKFFKSLDQEVLKSLTAPRNPPSFTKDSEGVETPLEVLEREEENPDFVRHQEGVMKIKTDRPLEVEGGKNAFNKNTPKTEQYRESDSASYKTREGSASMSKSVEVQEEVKKSLTDDKEFQDMVACAKIVNTMNDLQKGLFFQSEEGQLFMKKSLEFSSKIEKKEEAETK